MIEFKSENVDRIILARAYEVEFRVIYFNTSRANITSTL